MKERQKLEIEMNKCISDHSIITTFLSIRYFNPIQGRVLSWRFRGGGDKNACATYFGHISSMESRIFMKLDHQPNFHKNPCKDARARGENARTCDALQRFRSESTKIQKMRFSAIFRFHLLYQPIDTPHFFLGFQNFSKGLKGRFPPKMSPFFCFCLTTID